MLATTGKSLTGTNAREEGLPWAGSDVLLQKSTATVGGPYETADDTPALALVSDIPDSSNRGLALVLDLEAHSTGMTTPSSSETVVVDRVEEANDGVQEINTATDDQASSTEEAVAMVGEVASVSQQTTAEAENVSAAAEQQTASVAEVSDRVRSLASRADDLRSLLDVEVVEASDAGSSSTGGANRSRTTGSLADAGVETAGSSRSSASPDGGGVTDGDGGFNFDRADR